MEVSKSNEVVHILEIQYRPPVPILFGYRKEYGIEAGTPLMMRDGFYCVDTE